ncbi:hypothetical protein JYT83_00290 [bacterium AH-315-F18]|nr:hypothetical protein [bacterium AH-315-F18]
MQISEMSYQKRNGNTQAPLKYCELDTLAKVILMEAWRTWLTLAQPQRSTLAAK